MTSFLEIIGTRSEKKALPLEGTERNPLRHVRIDDQESASGVLVLDEQRCWMQEAHQFASKAAAFGKSQQSSPYWRKRQQVELNISLLDDHLPRQRNIQLKLLPTT